MHKITFLTGQEKEGTIKIEKEKQKVARCLKLLLEPLVHICIKMNGECEVIQNSLPPLFLYLDKIFSALIYLMHVPG